MTDATVDAIAPAFDRDGKYLYFLASTDNAHSVDWFSMVSFDRPVRRSVYAALLSADGEPRIDLADLGKRMLPLDAPAGEYTDLVAGPAGMIFYAEYGIAGLERVLSPMSLSLHRYRVGTREAEDVFSRASMPSTSQAMAAMWCIDALPIRAGRARAPIARTPRLTPTWICSG